MSEIPLPWPRFTTTTRAGDHLPDHLAKQFPQLIVPSGIDGLEVEPNLALIAAPDGRELIQLGHYHYGPICLDPATCHVVDMVWLHGEIVRGPVLVNSSLGQFIRSTRLATELFPYHSDDPDADLEAAAAAVKAQLEPIDPPAWAIDGYWDTFYWDIAIGDYSPGEFEPRPPA